jgi:hypothetical protein
MNYRGSFDDLEAHALDVTSMLGLVPKRNTSVVVVDIDDNDYRQMFGGVSPLKSETLRDLVSTIVKAEPKAIVIDIVTDPEVWCEIRDRDTQLPKVPIMWAYRPNQPEGTSPLPAEGSLDSWGVPQWPTSGPVVRQYYRRVPCEDQSCKSLPACKENNSCPSLAWDAWPLVKKNHPDLKPSSEELTIRFVRDQNSIRASEIPELAKSPIWSKPKEGDEQRSVLYGKTVILGGTYADQHETPLGRMAGVWIWANILETEMEGGGYRSPPWFVLLFLGLLESVLLIWLFRDGFKRGLLVSTIVLPFISVGLSFLVYHSARRWAYFALILIALIIEQCYEMLKEEQHKQVERLISSRKEE